MECFSMGRLVAAIGGEGEAISRLIGAGTGMISYDAGNPWTYPVIVRKVEDRLRAGIRRGPRPGAPRLG
jgi:hypothetical protein